MFSQLPMYQRQGSAAYKADLENSILFDDYLKNPHKNFKSIHIAGTNGKGSTSHMLASILQMQGYKVGLYTSPHLKDFRERIKINGKKITEKAVVDFIADNKKFISEIKPSFFEMTVFMAFDFFAKQKVDIAVIEVGMGGRLDSTNVITPIVSVITNIGLDHTKFLGDNLQSIAKEKAGIIKENVPVVIGKTQDSIKNIFEKKAKEKHSKIYFADNFLKVEYSLITEQNKQNIFIKNIAENKKENYELDLLGDYQKENIITVLQTVNVLKDKINIDKENISKGLSDVAKNTGLLGRWQIVRTNPKIVFDTGHNFDGILSNVKQIKNTPYKNLHLVLGFVNDKNFKQIIDLFPDDAIFYFAKPNIPRGLEVSEIKKYVSQKLKNYNLFGSVKSAYQTAVKNADFNDFIFVGGSTFVITDLL